MTCVGDWMKLSCGDRVYDASGLDPWDVPRHVGRVEAIHHGAFVKVRWEGTGWVSMLPLRDVKRMPRATSWRIRESVLERRRLFRWPPEGGFERDQPCLPSRQRAEPGTEQPLVGQDVVDLLHSAASSFRISLSDGSRSARGPPAPFPFVAPTLSSLTHRRPCRVML